MALFKSMEEEKLPLGFLMGCVEAVQNFHSLMAEGGFSST
jgi:hypothetical protein